MAKTKKQEITVRYVPNIFEREGKTVNKVSYDEQKPLYTILYECYKGKVLPDKKNPFRNHKVIINGVKIEKDQWKKTFLKSGDEIIITSDIKETLIVAVLGGVIGFAIGGPVGMMIGFSIGGLIGGILFAPKMPDMAFDTPTYGWDGMKSDVSPDNPMPIIYGEHRVPIRIINAFTSNQIQFDFSWDTVMPTDETKSGYVNTFTVNGKAVEFYVVKYETRVNPFVLEDFYYYPYIGQKSQGYPVVSAQLREQHRTLIASPNCHIAAYKVEYKLSTDPTWIFWGYTANFVNIDFPAFDEYDIRLTLLHDNISGLPSSARYYTPVTITFGIAPGGVEIVAGVGIKTLIGVPSVTEPDKSYLWAIGVIGEGEIDNLDISTIEINNNPIYNFDSQTLQIETRMGTNAQTAINGFNDNHSLQPVGVKLLQNEPYTWTTVGIDIEAFEINFALNGLYAQQNDGDIISWTITYQVEYKLNSASTWTDLGEITISAKQQSSFTKKFRKDGLTAGKYDIRVTRTSVNPSFNHVADILLTNIDEITYDEFTYPNTALVAMKMLATERLSGSMPTFTIMCRGLKECLQPKILDGASTELSYNEYFYDWDAQEYKSFIDGSTATWDGVTWVTKWTANPVWILYDIIRNTRYGLGKHVSTYINIPTLIEMANYSDTLVATEEENNAKEKRFRLDIAIDSSERAQDLLARLALTFRGYIFTSEGYAKIVIDKPEDPVQLFTMGNILAPGGKSSFQESFASLKATPNVVEVEYANAERNFERDIVAYEDSTSLQAGDPVKKKSISLFGITRTSQAIRLAKWFLTASKYCKRTANWGVGIDGIASSVGDVVSFQHDVPFWSSGGRVFSSGGGLGGFIIDEPIVLASGSGYEAKVRFSDDTIETRALVSSGGSFAAESLISVTPNFTQVPHKFDLWSVGRENLCTKPFRLLSVQRDSINSVSLTGLEYNATVYDDVTGIILPTPDYSEFVANLPVTNVSLSERLVKMKDGTIEVAIDVAFLLPADIAFEKANIYLSDNSGESWEFRGSTESSSFSIVGGLTDLITYRVAVSSVNKLGQEISTILWTVEEIYILGKSVPPENITGLIVSQSLDRIKIQFNAVSDLDLEFYEIRRGKTWGTGTVIDRTEKIEMTLNIFPFGLQTYWVKARDTSGNYSTVPASAGITISDIPNRKNILTVNDDLSGTIGTGLDWEYSDLDGVSFKKCILIQTESVWDDDSATWDEAEAAGETYDYPVKASGYYTMAVQDIGFIAEAIVKTSTNISAEGDEATSTVEMRYSTDNIAWSAWGGVSTAAIEFRYAQFRIKLETTDTGVNIRIFGFYVEVDIPEIIERFYNETIAAIGTTVSFTKTFHTDDVSVIVTAINNPYTPYVTNVTKTGCKVYLRDTELGVLVSGNANILISGF